MGSWPVLQTKGGQKVLTPAPGRAPEPRLGARASFRALASGRVGGGRGIDGQAGPSWASRGHQIAIRGQLLWLMSSSGVAKMAAFSYLELTRTFSYFPIQRYACRASTPRQPTDLALFVRGPRPRGQASQRNSRHSAHPSPTRVRGCARCALAARCRLEPPNDSVWCLLPAAPCSVRRRVPTHTVSNRPTPYSPPSQPCAGVKRRFDESSGGRADDEWRQVVPEGSAGS